MAVSAGLLIKTSIQDAQAAAPFSEFAVGPYVGTGGIGIAVTTSIVPKFLNLVIGYSYFDSGFHATYSGQKYRENIRFGGAPVYLSTYPFGPHFHIDAGIFINETRIRLSSFSRNDTYSFQDHIYVVPALGTVSGQTHYNVIAPYLGVGWGNPLLGSRWTFALNIGGFFEGTSKVILRAANENAVPGAAANIDAAERSFNHKISFLSVYPVLSFGLDYRF